MSTPTLSRILSDVEDDYHLAHGTLLGRDRHRTVAEARQLAVYLARTIPEDDRKRTLCEIASAMERRHSVLIYGTRRIVRRLASDTTLQATEARIRAGLCTDVIG